MPLPRRNNPFAARCLLAGALLLAAALPAHAGRHACGPRRTRRAVIATRNVAARLVVVPVVFYKWDGPAAVQTTPSPPAASAPESQPPLAPESQPRPAPESQPPPAPESQPGLVSQRCAACHQGAAPAAGLDLTGDALGKLDDATRLRAIARLLADDPAQRMPKGTDISADERGLLIQHFAQTISREAAETQRKNEERNHERHEKHEKEMKP